MRKISFGLLSLGIFIIVILGLVSANVKSDLINHSLPSKDEIIDSTIIHFIHGAIPEKGCIYKKKRLGGYLGGHIEIEVNNEVFGFLYDSLPINYVSKNSFNSNFEIREKKQWDFFTKNDKITSIHIPISQRQKEHLYRLLKQYVKREPYDYAIFGQRCTSSTAEILSDVGILNKFSNLESIIAFFYPRTLRYTLLQFAKKNKLKIELQKGIECHKWE